MDRFNLEDFKKIQETNAEFSYVKQKNNKRAILEGEADRLRKKVLTHIFDLVENGENTLDAEIVNVICILKRLENFVVEYVNKQSVFHSETKDDNMFAKELEMKADSLLDVVSKL